MSITLYNPQCRFINEEDIKFRRKVCVIGERTQAELFEKNENPIGEYIRIDNIYFQVTSTQDQS